MSSTADFGLLQLSLQSLIAWLTVQGLVLSGLKPLCSGLGTLGTVTWSTVSWDYIVKTTNFTWFRLRKHGGIYNYLISYLWCIRHVNQQVFFILTYISVKNWGEVQPFSSRQTFCSFKCLCRIKCGGILAPKCLVHKIDACLVSSFPSLCSLLVILMPSNAWSTGIKNILQLLFSLSESQLV